MSRFITHGFTPSTARAFHGVISSRGNKELLYKYCYSAQSELTASEKDELLICSRITKVQLKAAK